MNPARFLLPFTILSLSVGSPRPLGAAELRPKLQIINGSQPIDIFWLKSDTERVPNGSVASGRDIIITAMLGHRFAIVGRDGRTTAIVTNQMPVHGFPFDPQGRNGVPAFYTQFVSANGFPIVASAQVNPYGLEEAASLSNLMFAKRPELPEAMVNRGARLCLMAYIEHTADDPGLAALCREVFEDASPPYTKPTTRLTAHLVGYDPGAAPTFVWPDRSKQAKAQIRTPTEARDKAANRETQGETRDIAGWTLHISRDLLATNAEGTEAAVKLLTAQLEAIVRDVPPAAVAELKAVTLYFSPEYPGVRPRAEYHPNAGWLREHGRDPAMAKGVEFTNLRIFEAEAQRMPAFALHELAHSYHNRVLPQGFGNPEIKAAYERAKTSSKYDHVQRWNGPGKPVTHERAYAMTNPQEFFAENTEAFFSRNDFFPFTRAELKQYDPETFALLEKLWNVRADVKNPLK